MEAWALQSTNRDRAAWGRAGQQNYYKQLERVGHGHLSFISMQAFKDV